MGEGGKVRNGEKEEMMFTLGDLVKRLSKEDQNKMVPLGLGTPHSYRGFYDELAFSPKKNVSVGEMLITAKSAIGTTYTGWKGGEFRMEEWVQVWLAEDGDASGQSIGNILLDYMLGKYK